ncbi:MAG: hypothetical protein LUG55_08240 [Clostridiales bacterium]|nr:hypothetical protein [Clostridiales bacterium]
MIKYRAIVRIGTSTDLGNTEVEKDFYCEDLKALRLAKEQAIEAFDEVLAREAAKEVEQQAEPDEDDEDEDLPNPIAEAMAESMRKAAEAIGTAVNGANDTLVTRPQQWKKDTLGARGLLRLHCPECGKSFTTFLKNRQETFTCRCGHAIDLTAPLVRFEYTCSKCEKHSFGYTNIEDAEIDMDCICGAPVTLQWVAKQRRYMG